MKKGLASTLRWVYPFYLLGIFCLVLSLAWGLFYPVQAADQPGSGSGSRSVIPELKCVRIVKGGFEAVWGYQNKNNDEVKIPIGSKNHFNPSPENRDQPTTFRPGSVDSAFTTFFLEDQTLKWTLVGPDGASHTASASDGSRHCAGEKPAATHTPTAVSHPPTEPPTTAPTNQPPTEPPAVQPPTHTPQPTAVPPAHTAVPTPRPSPTATRVSVSQPPATATPTVRVATLPPPPTPQASQTAAIIPITGGDQANPAARVGLAQAIIRSLGLFIIGLGIALQGILIVTQRR